MMGMMMSTVQIRTRIERKLKKESDSVLKSIGLDAGSFVSMALTQLVNRRGLPFAVMEPDAAYFANEYGLTPAESAKAGAAMKSEAARARRTGKLREIKSSGFHMLKCHIPYPVRTAPFPTR